MEKGNSEKTCPDLMQKNCPIPSCLFFLNFLYTIHYKTHKLRAGIWKEVCGCFFLSFSERKKKRHGITELKVL